MFNIDPLVNQLKEYNQTQTLILQELKAIKELLNAITIKK